MSAHRAREPRQPVRIGARLKCGRGWSDVLLRNLSPHGVMGECRVPLARGEYVEMRCGAYVIVARLAWTGEDCFGARAQDTIALPALIAGSQGRAAPVPDRRRRPRPAGSAPRPKSLEERRLASARFGRAFEFPSLIFAGAALAGALGGAAHDALASPADRISQVLSSEPAR